MRATYQYEQWFGYWVIAVYEYQTAASWDPRGKVGWICKGRRMLPLNWIIL